MLRARQKDIRDSINSKRSIDIEALTQDEFIKFLNADKSRIACSTGTYGLNGLVLEVKQTGKRYATVTRSNRLLQLL